MTSHQRELQFDHNTTTELSTKVSLSLFSAFRTFFILLMLPSIYEEDGFQSRKFSLPQHFFNTT